MVESQTAAGQRYTIVTPTMMEMLSFCTECGVIAFSRSAHDKWHDGVEAIGRTAQDADNTAQMFRPLA